MIFRILSIIFILACGNLSAQSLSSDFYDMGSPNVADYYVDPSSGNDENSGLSAAEAKKTVTNIWNSIPQNSALSTGVRINLLPGTYSSNHLPNYWENRVGTRESPIILQALNGYGTVFFSRDINMSGVSYFYLIGVDIKNRTSGGYGDAFHAENSNYILLRGNSFNGAPNGRSSGGDIAHETLKFNQSSNIYIESNNIQGADDNAIDFVAVNYGHIRANRIHDTQGWCVYAKGGSSFLLIEGNKAYDCGEGGITAGQGTGFEFMVSPYLRFEANYIKIVNNIIYNVTGAALGVNGGYNILIAHNTAYKVGSRSHLIEVVYGERTCDGDVAACTLRQSAGGWGPTSIGSDFIQPIGNKNILIFNNIVYNPSGFSSGSQHFAIYGPRSPSASGIPSPQKTDTNLSIKGNLIWNQNVPLGIEDSDQGCQPDNTSCNLSQLQADNYINTSEPDFISDVSYDFRPKESGVISALSSQAISNFSGLESIAGPIAEGNTDNQLAREFSGDLVSTRPPGAIARSNSSVDFDSPQSGVSPPDSGSNDNAGPSIQIIKAAAKRIKNKIEVSITVKANDADGIASVAAAITPTNAAEVSVRLKVKSGSYSAKKIIKSKSKRLSLKITATDQRGNSVTKTKTFKVK